MAGLIAAAAISAGGALIQANQAKKAAQGAANAQNAALDNVKTIDIAKTQADAKAADVQKYKDQFALLNQVDPATGQLRDAANAGLAGSINDTNTQQSNQLLSNLFGENVNVDPNDAAFAAKLKDEAAHQLDLGGSLSPEQQAEFVRAGLEQGAGSGYQAGSSALKQGVGKLLASEQETLGNNRRNMAQQLFGFATDLNSKRIADLSGIAGQEQNASKSQFGKLFSLADLTDSRAPDIGLSGGDVAKLAIANNDVTNSVALQKGGVAANAINANGQANSNLAGGLVGAIGTGITAYKQNKLDSAINSAKIAGAFMSAIS